MMITASMNSGCSEYRERILRAAAGDLDERQSEDLAKHVAACASCAEESALYSAALGDLRELTDVPVPRHFFVSLPGEPSTPWSLFLRMSLAWRFAVSAAVAAVLVIGILALTRLQIRFDDNAVTLAFGALPPASPPPVAQPQPPAAIDTTALEDRIVQTVAERNRKETLEWVRTLRAEIARQGTRWSEEQRLILAAALAGVEARMDGRIAASAQTLGANTEQSIAALYQTVTFDREQDNAALNARMNRIALATEAKGNQTDAILDTLLQVAELRMK